ncbi:hepatic lectin-like [Engraulis encrasicolus]|uniref:hepatic lectin-like n=1 Tax=Engraulis encrasicolus TaxID=184585 RepID=UPI002FD1F58A
MRILEANLTDMTQRLESLQVSYDNATVVIRTLEANLTDVQEEAWEKFSDGWKYFNGNYYYFPTDRKTWADSRDACVTMGGHLVIIETQEEQYFLQEQKPDNYCWIGLTDSAKEGEWRWVDNTLLNNNITFWAGSQPDGNDPLGQDCIGLWTFTNTGQLLWDDKYCGLEDIYICEASI